MNDLDRLKEEYLDRERRLHRNDLYSLSNPAYNFMKAQLKRYLLNILQDRENRLSQETNVLEVGCGNGNVLMDFHQFGVGKENLVGVDLIPYRLQQARRNYSSLRLICADGQTLPFLTSSFDLVLQFTAFSSILDDEIKQNMALEMLRVVKVNGLILWYDFWLNPLNRQTRGILPSEIRQLFPRSVFIFRKITLAPPLARRLVPLSPLMARLLESLGIFNTHYLVAISPKMESSL